MQIKHNKIQTDQQLKYLYFSGDLRRYEYLTGEDLGYKPSVVEQTKFDYSTLGKIFNEGLTEGDKEERLLKSAKNIGGKHVELLKAI